MSGFEVETTIRAPRTLVWRAFTVPAELRRWFGWDAEGLDAEIGFIFVEHTERRPPGRLVIEPGHTVDLLESGDETTVRVTAPGEHADDVHDGMREGWRTFFEQLRHLLERHDPGTERRTLHLEGTAIPRDALAAVEARLPGARPWHDATFQRGLATPDHGEGLAVLVAKEPLGHDGPAHVTLTLTTHGLDDGAFAAVRDDWVAWWAGVARDPALTTA